ncbi:MAG: hypothetical protein MUP64_09480 [Anaerolineae bacterium]|nr:hypothetical protein [Anaerolineae bacterium]
MERHGLPALLGVLAVAALLLGCGLLPTSAPELQFAARDSTVARGECTILEWVVEGAEGYPVFLNGAEVDSSGWRQVCPEELTTYELVVGAPGGPYEERVTIGLEGEPGSRPEPLLSPTSLPPTTMPATPTTPPSVPSPTTKPPTPTTPPPPPAPTSTPPPPAPQPYTLELINQSGVTICHVRFTDPSQPPGSWGDDQLGGSLIGDGQSRTLEVPVGREYVIVEDCQGIQFGLCVMSSSPQSCTIYNMVANLVLHNNSGQIISYVYIVPSPEGTNGNWGDDQLGAAETIAPGATRTWPITATRYDLKAVGELGQEWTLYDVEVPTGMTPQSYDWTIGPVTPSLPGNLVLTNNGGQTICFVYISRSTESVWGANQLAVGEKIEPGQSRPWEVPPDTYDLKAEDCGHNVLDERYNQSIAGPFQWTIS